MRRIGRVAPLLCIIALLAVLGLVGTGCNRTTTLIVQGPTVRSYPTEGAEYVTQFFDGQQEPASKVFVRVTPGPGQERQLLVEIPHRRDVKVNFLYLAFGMPVSLPMTLDLEHYEFAVQLHEAGGDTAYDGTTYKYGKVLEVSDTGFARNGTIRFKFRLPYTVTSPPYPADKPILLKARLEQTRGSWLKERQTAEATIPIQLPQVVQTAQ